MNHQRQRAYIAALFELNLSEDELETLSDLHGRLTVTLGNNATPVTEQTVFAFNDALKAGASPRFEVLHDIVRYTDMLIAFGIERHASCVPPQTISVIRTFFDAARPPVSHYGEPVVQEQVPVPV